MKRKILAFVIYLVLISVFFVGGCYLRTEPYNLIVTNNSGESIKSIGFYQGNSSGGVSNADSSLIKSGEKFRIYMESSDFNLSVIDKYDNEYISKRFNLDFDANEDKVYKISIEKDSTGAFKFILR